MVMPNTAAAAVILKEFLLAVRKIGTGSFFNYGERLIQEEKFEKSLKK